MDYSPMNAGSKATRSFLPALFWFISCAVIVGFVFSAHHMMQQQIAATTTEITGSLDASRSQLLASVERDAADLKASLVGGVDGEAFALEINRTLQELIGIEGHELALRIHPEDQVAIWEILELPDETWEQFSPYVRYIVARHVWRTLDDDYHVCIGETAATISTENLPENATIRDYLLSRRVTEEQATSMLARPASGWADLTNAQRDAVVNMVVEHRDYPRKYWTLIALYIEAPRRYRLPARPTLEEVVELAVRRAGMNRRSRLDPLYD